MAAGRSGGRAGEVAFLEALTRSESKRDGGFKNNWSFDHEEENERDTDKDGTNLSVEDDKDSETSKGKKLNRPSEIVATSSGDFILKTYVGRNKSESFKTLKGNPIGLNMLSNSKKLSENAQNASVYPGTVVHGRRFHHAHAQIPVVKTAAQRDSLSYQVTSASILLPQPLRAMGL